MTGLDSIERAAAALGVELVFDWSPPIDPPVRATVTAYRFAEVDHLARFEVRAPDLREAQRQLVRLCNSYLNTVGAKR